MLKWESIRRKNQNQPEISCKLLFFLHSVQKGEIPWRQFCLAVTVQCESYLNGKRAGLRHPCRFLLQAQRLKRETGLYCVDELHIEVVHWAGRRWRGKRTKNVFCSKTTWSNLVCSQLMPVWIVLISGTLSKNILPITLIYWSIVCEHYCVSEQTSFKPAFYSSPPPPLLNEFERESKCPGGSKEQTQVHLTTTATTTHTHTHAAYQD